MKEVYKQGLEDGVNIAINHAIIAIMSTAQGIANENREPRQSDIIHLANVLADELAQGKVLPVQA